jgi:hypothetical protein
MKMRQRLNFIALLACLVVGMFTSFELRGKEVGLAQLLSIFFSGVGGGALLVVFIREIKK